MNERIKELAYDAEDYADSIVDQGGEFHETYTRKFAELIVRECINQINNTTPSNYENDFEEGAKWAFEESVIVIKEHFGVE